MEKQTECRRCGHPIAVINGAKRCLYCKWSEIPKYEEACRFRKNIMDINLRFVQDCHEKLLANTDGALTYMIHRGVSREAIEKWVLGYVPVDNNCPYVWGKSEIWERRILFPIWDKSGKYIIAAGARKITVDDRPKYVNSATSQEFEKNRNMYGSWTLPSRTDTVFLCEGYLDVISMTDKFGLSSSSDGSTTARKVYGKTFAVASLGTALTEEQSIWLKSKARKVIIAYDSDAPGQKAALRALDMLHKAGYRYDDLSVLTIDGAKDVDECLTHGGGLSEYAVVDYLAEIHNYEFMARVMMG